VLSGWHVSHEWVQTEMEELALGKCQIRSRGGAGTDGGHHAGDVGGNSGHDLVGGQALGSFVSAGANTTLLKHIPAGMSPQKASSPAVLAPARIRMPGLLPFFSWDQSLLGSGSPQNRSVLIGWCSPRWKRYRSGQPRKRRLLNATSGSSRRPQAETHWVEPNVRLAIEQLESERDKEGFIDNEQVTELNK
jgi:hypothetical protein